MEKTAKRVDIIVLLFGEVSALLATMCKKMLGKGELTDEMFVKLTDFYTSNNLLIGYSHALHYEKKEIILQKAIETINSMTKIMLYFADIEPKTKKVSLKDIAEKIKAVPLKKS